MAKTRKDVLFGLVTRYLAVLILANMVIFIVGTIVVNYNVAPEKAYKIDSINLIDDSSFEDFNQTAGDCCNKNKNDSMVFASKSLEAFSGKYSLNLTSSNQCACISKKINNFDNQNQYVMSFYYKGDKPRVCNWATGDNKCLPEIKFDKADSWIPDYSILSFTDKSEQSLVHFYADSDGTKTITNLYDDLIVRKLIPIITPDNYKYKADEEYIFETDRSNIIHNVDAVKLSENKEGNKSQYLVMGKPDITLKFPWTEIVIVVLITIIIVRLIIKKDISLIVSKK